MLSSVPPSYRQCIPGFHQVRRQGVIVQRGFSLLELLVVIVVIGVVAGFLLDRLSYYQEAAEKAEMEYTVSVLKSALRLRMAELMVAGRVQEYVSLAQQNPMDWLEKKPSNYSGSFHGAKRPVVPGNWYFDVDSRDLVYQVKNGDHFQSMADTDKLVRWRIVQLADPTALSAGDTQASTSSLRLTIVKPYRWF